MTAEPPRNDHDPSLIPSASVLLLRDDPEGLQVFMIVRHREIDFAAGALVFPGGKMDGEDCEAFWRSRVTGADDLDDYPFGLQIAAIRECFEECGVLLARTRESARTLGPLVDPAALEGLDEERLRLNLREVTFNAIVERHDLMLATDLLVPFAHWITPDMMPRRYDTHFFLVPCPGDQHAEHDGVEAVDSAWVNPARALHEAEEGKWTIIFPTRMNLRKLARSASRTEAIERAHGENVVTVKPWVEADGAGQVLCIPENAGYGAIREPLENLP